MVQAYSIGTSKRTDFVKNNTPGPGTYDDKKLAKKAIPQWKIGTEDRPSWGNSTTPGPGKYDAKMETESSKERSPTFQFGLKHNEEKQDYVPGPGTYDPKVSLETLPQYSLRPKTQYEEHLIKKKSKDPGPGFYETNYSTITKQPSSKIGNSQRTTFNIRSISPGPGRYLGIQYKPDMAKYGFGTEQRTAPIQQTTSTHKLNQIGPGSYNLKSTIRTSIGPILTPRRKDIFSPSNQLNPGPGSYNQQQDFIKNSDPSYKIGTEKQRTIFDARSQSPIGPGQYSPKINQIKNHDPEFRIGTSQRVNFAGQSQTPGPGTYKIPSKVVEGPKHIMVPRRDDTNVKKEQVANPAPNTYDFNLKWTKEKHSQIKIGSSQRPTMISRSLSPGPGRYQEKSKLVDGPQYSFGNQQRRGLEQQNLNPGPGQYYLKPTFADVPKYLIPDDSSKKIKL